jgi:ATP-binding cassette subfamily F protein uup
VLEDFLEKFNGCLVLVSHDRYFMDHLVDQLFVFEGDGVIQPFNGNYSDYRAGEDAADEIEPEKLVVEKPQKESNKKKFSFAEKKEYEELPALIEQLEAQKKSLTDQLAAIGVDHVKLQEISKRIQILADELDRKTERWMELEEKA